MKKLSCLWAVMMIALSFGGCAKAPVEEMDNAAAAVTRAENDPDAAAYAQETLILARNALANMQNEAAEKRYDSARAYAAEAVRAAERAVSDGRAGAGRAREEAAALLALLPGAIAETGQTLRAAEGKKLDLDLEALETDMEYVRRTADQAAAAAAADRNKEALELGQAARSALSQINAAISEAAVLASRKK
ncbi:MAG: DUF4398 domain-containing protein [Treponema sp.]|jgi:hypothetical protein|nr:DUF4398 domain-containing protein [Treponema sp.]